MEAARRLVDNPELMGAEQPRQEREASSSREATRSDTSGSSAGHQPRGDGRTQTSSDAQPVAKEMMPLLENQQNGTLHAIADGRRLERQL